MFDSIRKRQEQKRLAAALLKMKPYVMIPLRGQIMWWHWSQIAEAEAAGLLPEHEGLPVVMTKEECVVMNGGRLPDHWGEMPYAWRTEKQKQRFYASCPELSDRHNRIVFQAEKRTNESDGSQAPATSSRTSFELSHHEFDLLCRADSPYHKWEPGRYVWDISRNGPAIMPPSEEAAEILEMMNENDRKQFYSELEECQGDSGKEFPPQVRACMWGVSLANLAQSYRDAQSNQRALQYMHAAYRISCYPIFANDAAYLALAVGNPAYARNLFKCFLKDCQDTVEQAYFKFMEPRPTVQELERIIASARGRLAEIEHELEKPRNEANGGGYPTEAQIEEFWNAYVKDGGNGIREVLKRNREEHADE